MTESKNILTSKIFMSALIGLASSVAMYLGRIHGYDVVISLEVQSYSTTVILGLITVWRPMKAVPLHFKRPKK